MHRGLGTPGGQAQEWTVSAVCPHSSRRHVGVRSPRRASAHTTRTPTPQRCTPPGAVLGVPEGTPPLPSCPFQAPSLLTYPSPATFCIPRRLGDIEATSTQSPALVTKVLLHGGHFLGAPKGVHPHSYVEVTCTHCTEGKTEGQRNSPGSRAGWGRAGVLPVPCRAGGRRPQLSWSPPPRPGLLR